MVRTNFHVIWRGSLTSSACAFFLLSPLVGSRRSATGMQVAFVQAYTIHPALPTSRLLSVVLAASRQYRLRRRIPSVRAMNVI